MRVCQILLAVWTIGLRIINTHLNKLGGRDYRSVIRQGKGEYMTMFRQGEEVNMRKVRQEDEHYTRGNNKRTGFTDRDRQFNTNITSFKDGGLGKAIKLERYQHRSSIRNKRQGGKLVCFQIRRIYIRSPNPWRIDTDGVNP